MVAGACSIVRGFHGGTWQLLQLLSSFQCHIQQTVPGEQLHVHTIQIRFLAEVTNESTGSVQQPTPPVTKPSRLDNNQLV
jgi:hypothetical protein